MLRVLFIHTATRPPLGADTWIQALIIRHLERTQLEVHVACATGPKAEPTPTYKALRDIPQLTIKPVNLGAELFSRSLLEKGEAALKTAPAILSVIDLARYIKKHRIDIIHTSDRPRDALVSVLLARLTGAKSIVHVHVKFGQWMSGALRWAMGRADALIGVSEYVVDSLVNGGGYSASKCHAVLNSIDLAAWDYRTDPGPVRAELGISNDAPLIICVARIFRAKGQWALIEALASLRADLPETKLLIVGQDYPVGNNHTSELRALATELGVADNVIFTGLRSDVPRLMAASDILAMPSLEEPFGLVFAEAMAMKRPVVAFDSGGTPEVVEHEKSGLLSAVGDLPALAHNLRRLITDPGLRARLGEHGRKRVEAQFVPERLAQDVARVYSELVGRS
ncbi:MAG TPA: glycosyltransferase family 4 protein [Polyangiaceae bacterium]|nr:glycosyltransferase family 4 protein [Polyangiaceae bacterium]